MTREKAYQLRALIEKAAELLDDEDALNGVELFPAWTTGETYAVDKRVRHDGLLYKCVQAHTSQSDWTPDVTPAMWTRVAEPGTIPVWVQPTGAQDAYMSGDKVHYPGENDPVYVSTVDNNVWAPGVYGWEIEE